MFEFKQTVVQSFFIDIMLNLYIIIYASNNKYDLINPKYESNTFLRKRIFIIIVTDRKISKEIIIIC